MDRTAVSCGSESQTRTLPNLNSKQNGNLVQPHFPSLAQSHSSEVTTGAQWTGTATVTPVGMKPAFLPGFTEMMLLHPQRPLLQSSSVDQQPRNQ